jgi:hypothetical protein
LLLDDVRSLAAGTLEKFNVLENRDPNLAEIMELGYLTSTSALISPV